MQYNAQLYEKKQKCFKENKYEAHFLDKIWKHLRIHFFVSHLFDGSTVRMLSNSFNLNIPGEKGGFFY